MPPPRPNLPRPGAGGGWSDSWRPIQSNGWLTWAEGQKDIQVISRFRAGQVQVAFSIGQLLKGVVLPPPPPPPNSSPFFFGVHFPPPPVTCWHGRAPSTPRSAATPPRTAAGRPVRKPPALRPPSAFDVQLNRLFCSPFDRHNLGGGNPDVRRCRWLGLGFHSGPFQPLQDARGRRFSFIIGKRAMVLNPSFCRMPNLPVDVLSRCVVTEGFV